MARQFFSGNSLDQAIMAAARTFSIDPTEVQYTVREKKHGFVNARKRFVIEVDPESPKKDVVETAAASPEMATESLSLLVGVKPPGAKKDADSRKEEAAPRGRRRPGASEAPVSEKPKPEKATRATSEESSDDEDTVELPSEESDADVADGDDEDFEDDGFGDEGADEDDLEEGDEEDDLDEDEDDEDEDDEDEDEDDEDDEDEDAEIAAFLRAGNKLIDVLDVELDVRVERRDGEFFVDFSGEEADLLTEDDGKILQAIEQLLPRMVRGLVGHGLPCTIDCDGFKEEKIVELREMAESAAVEAKDSGEDVLLKPMNPADRRVVHLTLADDPDVETESSGDGFMKRVRIVPL